MPETPADPGASLSEIRTMGDLAKTVSDTSLPEQARDDAAEKLGAVMDRLPIE